MNSPLRAGDAAEVSALLAAALPEQPVPEERVRRGLFEHPGFDPALARASRSPSGRIESLAAAVRLPDGPDGARAQLAALATRPDSRRRGLARALYAEVETELRRRGAREVLAGHGGALGLRLDPLRCQAAATMLLRRLYAAVQVGYDMRLPPEAPAPEPRAPAGFALRALAPADAPALEALCAREFPGWKGTAALLRPGEPCGVSGAFAADGRLAAFAGWDRNLFGPTGTDPEFRRRGLGAAVFWHAVRAMRAAGFGGNLVIGCANVGYYARAFAAPIAAVVWRMRKDLAADPAVSKGKPSWTDRS